MRHVRVIKAIPQDVELAVDLPRRVEKRGRCFRVMLHTRGQAIGPNAIAMCGTQDDTREA